MKFLKEFLKEQKNIAILISVTVCFDYIFILGAASCAYWIRKHWIPLWHGAFEINNVFFYAVIPLLYLFFLHFIGSDMYRMQFWRQAQKLTASIFYATLLVIVLMYIGGISGGISRIFIFLLWVFVTVAVISSRYLMRLVCKKYKLLSASVIFIGAGKTAELLLSSFIMDNVFQYRILGFIDDHPVSKKIAETYPILGGFADLDRIIRETKIQNVIITAPGLEKERLLQLVNKIQLKVKNVVFVPDLIGISVGNISIDSLFNEKLVMMRIDNNLAKPYNQWLKRGFDIVVSGIGVLCLLPVLIGICIAVRCSSPGPAMFSHDRVGKRGRIFPCYKFRTMVPNAQAVLERHLELHPRLRKEWNESFKLKDDPRVTKIGAFLRKTSLDELPQLFNVLKGEMSLVGPRPIVKQEIEKYREYIEDYYLVLPGITGMWQVNGRSDTTYDERVAMDSWYVRNWSLWIDIVFLIKTVKSVLKKEGAY